jgi:glycosyltransferase involved in cell wall biosynthesis
VSKTTVLLTTDGTYPCYAGGVSEWCDRIIRGLPEVDFHVFAISYSPSQQPRFRLPPNTAGCTVLPLWGTEEPGGGGRSFAETYARKLRTTAAVIDEGFIRHFETAAACFLDPDAPPQRLAHSLLKLQAYFADYDYALTMASVQTWDAFLRACSRSRSFAVSLTLHEATTCMRWLQRYLAVINVTAPQTSLTHASMAGFAGIPGVLAKLRHGVPYLLTEHGIYLRELYLSLRRASQTEGEKRFLLGMNEAIVRMNYTYADVVTSLCDFNRQWQLRLAASPEKIELAPNGVDAAVFYPRGLPLPERPTVVTTARIYPLKGIDVLLRAAAIVRREVPDVLFRIYGDVADADYFALCERIIREGELAGAVEFSRTSEPAAVYNAAHVFCLSSISEGMPYSLIEAMLCGCPAVATDVGGVAEILEDTGIVVRPNAPPELAAALLELLRPGPAGAMRRAELAARALDRARTRYGLRQSVERFEDLYGRLLEAYACCVA